MNTEYEQHEKVCKASFQTQIIIIHSDVLCSSFTNLNKESVIDCH